MRLILLILLACTVTGCRSGPPEDRIIRARALQMNDVMTVEILTTWDTIRERAQDDPEVSHWIQVKVLKGPPRFIQKTLTFPYDEFVNDRKPPPEVGTTLTIMPSMWVQDRGLPR